MSHIFTESGEGSSENSLTEAINNAMGGALRGHDFGGDHICNLMILLDGYEFDGKKYRVKLRVIIFDYELAREDYYKALEVEHNDHEKQDMMVHYYSALLHQKVHSSQHDDFMHEMLDMFENHQHIAHLDELTMIAPEPVHEHLATEWGRPMDVKPVYPRPHTDLAEPTLGPGTPSGSHNKDEAA